MRTLIVSDLHLGARSRVDLARRPELREPLLRAAEEADLVLLLGDALELRHGPVHAALAAARGFFSDLGDAVGDGEVVLVPGNHDHELLAPWLARRRRDGAPPALALEERVSVAAGDPAAPLVRWLGRARLELAYPGVWLGPRTYAIHGHYLDCHITVPTFERLAVGAMTRLAGAVPTAGATPDDYEAALAPIYAWIDAVAQHAPVGRVTGVDGASTRAWRSLSHEARRPRLRNRALRLAIPPAIGALNRAGIGPLNPALTGLELRRAGLRALGEVIGRLDVEADHVIFGHTHRAGPWPADDPAEWIATGGGRLVNSGSWIYEPHFLTARPGESPYWPGACIEIDDDGRPRLRRLLEGRSHDDLAPVGAARSTPAPA